MKIINVGSRAMNTWLYAVSDGWVMVDTGYPESMGRVIHRMKRAGDFPGRGEGDLFDACA